MTRRIIAIGDIHGCSIALSALLDAIQPGSTDTIITLGDYIDRGPDSRGVVSRLIELRSCCHLVPLMGNHEELLLAGLVNRDYLRKWLNCGGSDTLKSYGWSKGTSRRSLSDWIPQAHQEFLSEGQSYHETKSHFFVHAGYVPDLPLREQPGEALRWKVTNPANVQPHCSNKVAIVGHTPQLSGEVLDLGFLICIDTHCVRGQWLTALEVNSGQIWQANQKGKLRQAIQP